MRVVIKRDATVVDEDGHVAGHDAGATLVRRFLRIFPESAVTGPGARRCDGFDMIPVDFVDPETMVVINMDVIDSMDVWNTIYKASGGKSPQIMNFVWWAPGTLTEQVQIAAFAMSCALFPTFSNSERTANEVRELVSTNVKSFYAEQAKLAWVNLGFRLDHVQEREETAIPIVLYPAIYLNKVKQPEVFMSIMERVRKSVPIEVEMRLHESSLVSEKAMAVGRKNWVWVGPLTVRRDSYWHALARTTAFVATAVEESYGLSYVEAMGAGVIGIFPDRGWSRALLPDGYPFLYQSEEEAADMLKRAVTDPDGCRAELDALVGGSFVKWIDERHSDAAFDREVRATVEKWFGA